jgi:uncharacterized protein YdhG (YjbR/CyaY superfamily)
MARASFGSVDEYIAAQPDDVRAMLDEVRAAIRRTLPAAEEGISYAIPAYRIGGAPVVYFAAFRGHWSLFPANDRLVAALGDEVAARRGGKGTLRFPLSEPVPVALVERVAAFLAAEAAERATGKPGRARARG